jgi:transposase
MALARALRHVDRRAHAVVSALPGDAVHHVIGGTPEKLRTRDGRAFLTALDVPVDARERIEVALRMIDALEAQIAPLERELRQLARRQTGCRALVGLYGMGELTSLVTLGELGDVGRLSASRKAVRMAGIDIGVHRSDRRPRVGKLTRQGSPQLRWALYEAAPEKSTRRTSAPPSVAGAGARAAETTATRRSGSPTMSYRRVAESSSCRGGLVRPGGSATTTSVSASCTRLGVPETTTMARSHGR